jgi:CobQ-like glutamine amidotransferase family enzyme
VQFCSIKNGRVSSEKKTKHIRVRYFFIKDRISSGEITAKHCPEMEMLGDHFTKPFQGPLFSKFRAEIQGIPIDMCDADLGWDGPCIKSEQTQVSAGPSPQECVGTHADRAYVDKTTNVVVPSVVIKYTRTVSKDTAIGGTRGRRTGRYVHGGILARDYELPTKVCCVL